MLPCVTFRQMTNRSDFNVSATGDNRPAWWVWGRLFLLGALLTGLTTLAMVRPFWQITALSSTRVVLEAGEVAPYDIRAPRRVTFESEILGAEARQQAAAAVEPIYTPPDPSLARQQLDRARQVLDYLGSVRADPLAFPAQKRGWILAVEELSDLPTETLNAILSLPDESWDRVVLETLAVVDQAMRREIRDGRLGEVLEEVPAWVSLDMLDEEVTVTVALAQRFLVPNSFLNVEATAAAIERARQEVPPVLRTFEAGEIIVREGTRVTPLDIEALDQMALRQPQIQWADWVGAALMATVMTVLLGIYLGNTQPTVLWTGRQLLLLVLLIGFSVLAAGLMVPAGVVLRYLTPAPTLALLATATLGLHPGLAAAIFLGGVTGVIADYSLEMAVYTTLGGLTGALLLGRIERISALFRSGLYIALTHIVVIIVFRLFEGGNQQPTDVLISLLSGVGNGGISASLALGGLFLIGPLFDLTTTIRLIELSRPDHPLLQRLLREATATYHHSLMVANLAEQAAEHIGADALLTRVGAYYHDVGKIARPYFFTENQAQGINPHDRLDPRTSAQVLIGHVQDGIELARRYRLPARVRAFISEHHGTNRVSFLYEKAIAIADDPKQVNPNDFRYPGPKPQSKETALVMLADGCEAAVRSARPASPEEVTQIVQRIIEQRIADSQLSESGLTLRDVEQIREALATSLRGVFHPRITYPPSVEKAKEVE